MMATTGNTTDRVWGTWTTGSDSTTSIEITTQEGAWQQWVSCDAATTSANDTSVTVASDQVWGVWIADGDRITFRYEEPTQEELEARAERQRIQEEQRLEAKRLKEVADQKALDLLMRFLEDEQLQQLESEGAFVVKTKEREYRIEKGWQGNVKELNKDGEAIASWCIHPSKKVPHQDNMLAQKFLLETNEDDFRRIANRTAL